MLSKNIFLIESPFQALCCIEFANQSKVEKNVFLVKKYKNKLSNQQILDILRNYEFSKSIIVIPSFNVKFLSDVFTLFILSVYYRFFNFENIIVGEVSSQVALSYLQNIKSKGSFAIDDGFNTVNVQSYIQKCEDLYEKVKENKKFKFYIRFFIKVLFLKRKKMYFVNWYTCFNLKPVENQIVVKNNFLYLNKRSTNFHVKNSEDLYFLGGPYSELGILESFVELECIKKLFLYSEKNNLRFFYCVHRRDSLNKIHEIENIVGHNRIIKSELPIELYFLNNKIYPKILSGISSTALITLNRLFTINSTILIENVKYNSDIHKINQSKIIDYLLDELNNIVKI